MSRLLLVLVLFLLVLAGGGLLALGLFPPRPAAHVVQIVLPNQSLHTQ
ncbi:MAG: hypothetical protein ACP5NI_01055 [Acetobacteraceae bacterium]